MTSDPSNISPDPSPDPSAGSGPSTRLRRLSRRQRLVLGIGAVAVVAVAGGVTAAAVTASRPEPTDTRASTSQQFDLEASNAAGRVRTDENATAVGQLKKSGFTPVHAGELTVAVSASAPPLAMLASDDNSTVIGEEADVAQLVADGLGLKLRLVNVSWADWPLGVQSGKYDLVASNVTVTEERKKLFDFASTRQDLLGFLVASDGGVSSIEDAEDISGLKLAVGSGTNQEKVLLEWNKELKAAGKTPAELIYYDDTAAASLAIAAHRIDGYLGPNPSSQYTVATGDGKFKVVGTIQGGWPATAPIAIGTKKGDGLITPVHTVLAGAIEDGSYARVLQRWGLADEAVKSSRINPEGIPASVGG